MNYRVPEKGHKSRDGTTFLSDDPIEHRDEDKLNLSSYVDVIERLIRSRRTPLNIGLFGQWGVGKTSILNLLKERVTTIESLRGRFDFFSIDAWKLSEKSLRQQLLIDLNKYYKEKSFTEEQIEDNLFNITEIKVEEETKDGIVEVLKKLGNFLAQYWDYFGMFFAILVIGIIFRPYLEYYLNLFYSNIQLIVTSFLIPMLRAVIEKIERTAKVVRLSAKKIIPRVEYPHQFERMFKRILKGRKEKTLIIAVDNLDRCEDSVVVDMLGTIKNFMNVPGCVFILACDNQAIERHIISQKGEGFKPKDAKEFLRKFFHAPLKILPFLDEDLENFMDDAMKKLDVDFDEEVKEVLMSATTKNPRRVKQFLNSLVSTYYLAEVNERVGLIRKGIITGNTGFLAKITVIRDEWPKFYRVLEKQEDILNYIERYFKGESFAEVHPNEIEQYFQDNDGLEWFLKATRTIQTADISPFLKLSQESYERTLPEHERFVRRVEFGDTQYVSGILNKLDKTDRMNYFREILKTIDNDMKRKRFNYVFNALNVSCEIFSEIPTEVKPEFVYRFEKYAPSGQLKQHLEKFSPSRFFAVLEEMREIDRETILMHYCDFLVTEKEMNEKLLDLFISKRNILTARVIDRLNSLLVEVKEKNEVYALRILQHKFISDPDVKKSMINQRTIGAVIEKIDGKVSEINSMRVETYSHLKDIAARNNKASFVRKILSILSVKTGPSLTPDMQFALETLSTLEADDVPVGVVGDLYDAVVKAGASMSNTSHRLQFFKLILKHLDRLDQERKATFIEQHIKPLIVAGNEQMVTEIVDVSDQNKVPLLRYDGALNALMKRVGTNLPVNKLVDYLMIESPATKKQSVGKMLVNMIQSNNNTLISSALEGFQKNVNHLPAEVADEITRACLNTGKGKPPQQMKTFFDPIATTLERCSDASKSMFVDQILTQMKADDPKLREIGVAYYERVKTHIPEHKRRYVLGQLISKLGSVQDQIDVSAKSLIDTVIHDQNILEPDDMVRFIDILIGQLVSAKPEATQIVGLEGVRRLEKLHRRRSNTVLRAVLDLSRSSSAKVRELCREVLMAFKDRYKGPRGFWEEVEGSIAESVEDTSV